MTSHEDLNLGLSNQSLVLNNLATTLPIMYFYISESHVCLFDSKLYTHSQQLNVGMIIYAKQTAPWQASHEITIFFVHIHLLLTDNCQYVSD